MKVHYTLAGTLILIFFSYISSSNAVDEKFCNIYAAGDAVVDTIQFSLGKPGLVLNLMKKLFSIFWPQPHASSCLFESIKKHVYALVKDNLDKHTVDTLQKKLEGFKDSVQKIANFSSGVDCLNKLEAFYIDLNNDKYLYTKNDHLTEGLVFLKEFGNLQLAVVTEVINLRENRTENTEDWLRLIRKDAAFFLDKINTAIQYVALHKTDGSVLAVKQMKSELNELCNKSIELWTQMAGHTTKAPTNGMKILNNDVIALKRKNYDWLDCSEAGTTCSSGSCGKIDQTSMHNKTKCAPYQGDCCRYEHFWIGRVNSRRDDKSVIMSCQNVSLRYSWANDQRFWLSCSENECKTQVCSPEFQDCSNEKFVIRVLDKGCEEDILEGDAVYLDTTHNTFMAHTGPQMNYTDALYTIYKHRGQTT